MYTHTHTHTHTHPVEKDSPAGTEVGVHAAAAHAAVAHAAAAHAAAAYAGHRMQEIWCWHSSHAHSLDVHLLWSSKT